MRKCFPVHENMTDVQNDCMVTDESSHRQDCFFLWKFPSWRVWVVSHWNNEMSSEMLKWAPTVSKQSASEKRGRLQGQTSQLYRNAVNAEKSKQHRFTWFSVYVQTGEQQLLTRVPPVLPSTAPFCLNWTVGSADGTAWTFAVCRLFGRFITSPASLWR